MPKEIEVNCMACGRADVKLTLRKAGLWARLKGLKFRYRGVCPACRYEATINGWR